MNRIKPASFMASLLLILASVSAENASTDRKSRPNYLFMVVVNGVRYDDAFGDKNHLYIDNIWNKLRPLGTICTNFYNRELTYPIPAQASLLTGVWHIYENPLSESIRPAVPTIFEYWTRSGIPPANSSYFAASRKGLGILSRSDTRDYGKAYAPVFETNPDSIIDTSLTPGKTDVVENAIYEKAVAFIFKNHPSCVYLNLGSGRGEDVYTNPHECVADSKKDSCAGAELLNAYYESIILVDAIVWDLWDRIQHDPVYKDKSTMFVLSSHGRHTNDFHGFGDKCKGCQQLFLLAVGPGIKKNFVSKRGRTLIDICRTVGALANIPTPFAKGDVMKELLE